MERMESLGERAATMKVALLLRSRVFGQLHYLWFNRGIGRDGSNRGDHVRQISTTIMYCPIDTPQRRMIDDVPHQDKMADCS